MSHQNAQDRLQSISFGSPKSAGNRKCLDDHSAVPVLAHARYISLGYASPQIAPTDSAVNGSRTSNTPGPGGLGTQVEVWLDAMEKVVENQAGELKRFEQ